MLQYNAERLTLTAEQMEEPVDYDGFGSDLDEKDSTVQGYYPQGSYLLRNDPAWVVRYSEGFADKDDRDGRVTLAASGGFAPAHSLFRKDWIPGLRRNATPNFILRAAYHWNDNPMPGDTERDWEVSSLLGSCRF